MKKFLALLLAFLLLLTLVACGEKEDQNGDVTTTSTTSTTGSTTTNGQQSKPESYAGYLRIVINPEFEVYFDANKTVIGVVCLNADALTVADGLSLIGTSCVQALETILNAAEQKGFDIVGARVAIEGGADNKGGLAFYDDIKSEIKAMTFTLNVSSPTLGYTTGTGADASTGHVTVTTDDGTVVTTDGGEPVTSVVSTTTTTAATTTTTTATTTTTTTATTTTTTTAKSTTTTTTTKAAANKNPQTDLEYSLEYIGNFIDNGSVLDASALQFEQGDELIAVVTSRMFEAEKTDPDQVPFEYFGKQWYSVGGGLSPHYYELTSTEIIVKGCLWGEDPDAVNIRLVLQENGTLKVTEVSAEFAARFPVGTEMKIYFR